MERISTAGKFLKTNLTIKIKKLGNPEPIPFVVPAFVHECGLAVHRRHDWTPPEANEKRRRRGHIEDSWKVSHVLSGKSFAQFKREGDARQFVLRMANVVDWRASEETILSHSTKIRAAMSEAFDGLSRVY